MKHTQDRTNDEDRWMKDKNCYTDEEKINTEMTCPSCQSKFDIVGIKEAILRKLEVCLKKI